MRFDLNQHVVLWLDQPDVTIEMPETACAPQNVLRLVQTGPCRSITWPGDVRWPGGFAPMVGPDAGDQLTIVMHWDGRDFYGTTLRSDAESRLPIPTEMLPANPTLWERLDGEED